MDSTLGYLRETLSNHLDHPACRRIYKKLATRDFTGEGDFVRHLNEMEMSYLNEVLLKEMDYAKQAQDEKRHQELNEVFELLT
ncbi:sigma-G-dependent sporulation-specific acid-soluble spore protein CsgA [Heyndrickxia acidiproducens]|uniref:sigma-G-dependent sporulation-specific acid-soluble spore protein CsgA n=1 Tax=Heyndrickxia acidiproducens TaxID=1121084 RepID=UPI000370D1B7|nr:sigma-G-dependent sporulation-specific acid-soluble spore protein CsgA [Heyndrickxia acidiproducens]